MATATPNLARDKRLSALSVTLAGPAGITCEYLSESHYWEWDRLVNDSPHGTIFHSSWWLRIAAPSFRLLVARDERGHIRAGLPLPVKRVAGLRLCHSPNLTPYLGPIFEFSGMESDEERLQLMRTYGEVLSRHVTGFDSFRYVAGALAPDLHAFLRAGFRVFLGYTFRFTADQSLESVRKGISRTHMQKITKASRLGLQVIRDEGFDTLLQLNKMTFQRQGLNPPYSDHTALSLWQAAFARGQASLYIAKTADGAPVAGLFCVHDGRTTTQIVSGIDPNFPDVPGQNLVLWCAIQDALKAGRDFDFEGSELRGVEAFYRRWGALAFPVWRMEKTGTIRGLLAQTAIRHMGNKKRPANRSAQTRNPTRTKVSGLLV